MSEPRQVSVQPGIVSLNRQPAKGWSITTTVIGILVVIGVGGVGTTGLLQSHGIISLPKGISSALGKIPYEGLLTMAIGGVLGGGSLITYGSCEVHKARMHDWSMQILTNSFSAQNFNRLANRDDYVDLKSNRYVRFIAAPCHWIVKKDSSNELQVTETLEDTTLIKNIETALKAQGYTIEETATRGKILQQQNIRQAKALLKDAFSANNWNENSQNMHRYYQTYPPGNNKYCVNTTGSWDSFRYVPERYLLIIQDDTGKPLCTKSLNETEYNDVIAALSRCEYSLSHVQPYPAVI